MGEVAQTTVKWLMFIFNLLFWITGIGLIAAGAVFQVKYNGFSHFFDQGITAPTLLIIVGVFIFVISFLGCCGAIRENYYMLMGFGILVGLIFVLQMAGGIAALVQRGKIPELIRQGIRNDVRDFRTGNASTQTKANIDELQKDLQCCGEDKYMDFLTLDNGTVIFATNNTIPKTCCKDNAECRREVVVDQFCNSTAPTYNVSACPIYIDGCATPAGNLLHTAITGAAGVALGLAFIELIGIVFSCYLAKRIRSGYTYA